MDSTLKGAYTLDNLGRNDMLAPTTAGIVGSIIESLVRMDGSLIMANTALADLRDRLIGEDLKPTESAPSERPAPPCGGAFGEVFYQLESLKEKIAFQAKLIDKLAGNL